MLLMPLRAMPCRYALVFRVVSLMLLLPPAMLRESSTYAFSYAASLLFATYRLPYAMPDAAMLMLLPYFACRRCHAILSFRYIVAARHAFVAATARHRRYHDCRRCCILMLLYFTPACLCLRAITQQWFAVAIGAMLSLTPPVPPLPCFTPRCCRCCCTRRYARYAPPTYSVTPPCR